MYTFKEAPIFFFGFCICNPVQQRRNIFHVKLLWNIVDVQCKMNFKKTLDKWMQSYSNESIICIQNTMNIVRCAQVGLGRPIESHFHHLDNCVSCGGRIPTVNILGAINFETICQWNRFNYMPQPMDFYPATWQLNWWRRLGIWTKNDFDVGKIAYTWNVFFLLASQMCRLFLFSFLLLVGV